jgi:hypothetical protein
MSIKEKDIKLLWGRAANRCSFPDCRMKLSQDNKTSTESFPIGEQAHIVGKEACSARSESILTEEERESYHNLILLCPNHHTLIDKNPKDYPIEKLHMMKAQHEYWVENTLSESRDSKIQAADIIYAHYIDLAVEECSLKIWEQWVSSLSNPSHRIRENIYEKSLKFTITMRKAVWPGKLRELEAAMKLFSGIMNTLLNFYIKNAEGREDYYTEDRSYKRQWHTEEIFRQLMNKRDRWEKYLDELIEEVVKAANWLADLVRRDINPLFMAIDGKFSLVSLDGLYVHTDVPEYSADEKMQLIDSFEEKCISLKSKADAIEVEY